MSSPRKRAKLSPKLSLSMRTTQESKITSTPKNSSGSSVNMCSSNISSITLTNRSVRTRLSDVFEANECQMLEYSPSCSENGEAVMSFASSSEVSESPIETGNYDKYFNKIKKIKYTGTIWTMYKPLKENSLYAKVLEDPTNVQAVITDLLLLYKIKPETVVRRLVKFCLDVSGFQNFEVGRYFKFNDSSAKDVIKLLESNEVLQAEETLKDRGRYLFMEPTKTTLAKTLKIAIYSFMHTLILTSYERGILYDEFFSKNIFTFIKCMCFSNLKCVHHTGVILSVKILTALVLTYNNLLNDPNCSTDESNALASTTGVRIRDQKEALNNLLEYFYFIFIKNCRTPDHIFLLMRVECIRELQIWIRYFPKMFINELQAVSYLIKLVVDESKEVRLEALIALERLSKTHLLLELLKPIKQEFTEAVGKRFYDVDYKVAIKAINIFTILLDYERGSFISSHRFKIITSLIFDQHFPIGEAACRFMINFLQSSNTDPEFILDQLARLSLLPGDCRIQCIVEGCLYDLPAITNWKLYVKLLQGTLDLNVKEALAEMLSEAVHQSLKGTSTKMRDSSRKVTNIDPSEHQKVANLFPQLNQLLHVHNEHPKILIQLLKIFPLVNNKVLDRNICKDYTDLCGTIIQQFDSHTEENLLETLAETLNYLCNVPEFAERAIKFTQNVSVKYSQRLMFYLSQPDKNICEISLKVSILYAFFNFNDKFAWESLFDSWGEVDEITTANLLCCCKYFQIWSLRNLTDTTQKHSAKELPNIFALLMRTCNEYINTCFNMLQHLNGQQLHYKVYECLCDFYITFTKDLEAPIKFNKEFEKLKLKIRDNQLQIVLESFLDKYVICNKNMLLSKRREYVVMYIDLAHNNVLPTEALAYIFKYYHAYNMEYGPIIDSSMSSIINCPDENTILLLIMYTLTLVYESILDKYTIVDVRTEEARNMKLLIKQLLKFKYFRTPNRQFKKLIYFSVKYSLKDESKHAFLYFVRYFLDWIIEQEDMIEVFQFFKQKLSREMEKSDAVLYFVNTMKNASLLSSKKDAARKTATTENVEPKPQEGEIPVSSNKKAGKATVNTKKVKAAQSTPVSTTAKRPVKKRQTEFTENETEESEEDLTIHDSESDDMEEFMTGLKI